MTEAKIDLVVAREHSKHRSDIKFMDGLRLLERAESSGRPYSVIYCSDDPAVVDTVVFHDR